MYENAPIHLPKKKDEAVGPVLFNHEFEIRYGAGV